MLTSIVLIRPCELISFAIIDDRVLQGLRVFHAHSKAIKSVIPCRLIVDVQTRDHMLKLTLK